MVRPELRLRGRSASEEGEESLCDTVLYCIFLLMRCVRLRCVRFCVFYLTLAPRPCCVCLLTGESSSCLSGPWYGQITGESFKVSPVCGSPVLEDAASLGNGAFGSGLDLTIFSCMCYVLKVDYIVS